MILNDDSDRGSRSFAPKLGALLFLAGIFLLNFISRVILAPLMPTIKRDLSLTHGQAGTLFLMISIGYFFSLAGSGFVSSRLGHKLTIIISAVATGAAMLLVSRAGSLETIYTSLVLLGIGAGLYLPSGIATITSLVSQKNWGKALAVHELAPNLSLFLAPVLTEIFLDLLSWRGILAVLGGLSILAGAAFIRFGPGQGLRGESPRPEVVKDLVVLPSFWIMMVVFGLGIGGSVAVYSMLPLYLVAGRGLEGTWVNTLIALSRISSIFMAFVAGWVTDRIGANRTMAAAILTTGLVTILLAVLPGPWLVVMVFIQPAVSACFFPPAFAALSRIGPPETNNVAVSLVIPLASLLGIGLMPAAIGYIAEAGAFDLGMALTGVVVLLGLVLLRFLKFSGESLD